MRKISTHAKPILLALFLIGMAASTASAQSVVTLREGTTVRMRLIETLDTGAKLQVGSQIAFEVADPVMVNNQIVIRPGARGIGTLTEATKAKWAGRKGKLDFTIDFVEAVDGQNVSVRSSANRVKGKGNVGLMAAGALLISPVAIIVRGKNAVVEKGTEFTVYIDEDRDIEVR